MYCGAVPGTSILGIAVLPLAATLMRGFAAALSVFELFVLRQGLSSPLPSCSLALYTVFFTLLSLRGALKFFSA
jgi:hypothetical protein